MRSFCCLDISSWASKDALSTGPVADIKSTRVSDCIRASREALRTAARFGSVTISSTAMLLHQPKLLGFGTRWSYRRRTAAPRGRWSAVRPLLVPTSLLEVFGRKGHPIRVVPTVRKLEPWSGKGYSFHRLRQTGGFVPSVVPRAPQHRATLLRTLNLNGPQFW
jgi:hypothetical protein